MKQLDDKELFGSKFQDFGAAPSDAVWKGIEAAMPQEKKKKRGAFWWWSTGLAACLILSFGIYVGLQTSDSTYKNTHSASSNNVESYTEKSTTSLHSSFKSPEFSSTRNEYTLIQNPQLKDEPIVISNSYSDTFSSKNTFKKAIAAQAKKELMLLPKDWLTNALLPSIDPNSSIVQITSNDSAQRKHWRIGLGVEQSIRSTFIDASTVNYNWYRSRSIFLDAQMDLSKRFTLGMGLEYSEWDNVKKAGGNLKPSTSNAIGIPLHLSYFINPKNRLRLGLQMDIRNRYFFQQTDTVYQQPISAGVSTSYENFNGIKATQKTNAFQQQYGLGLVIHWDITHYIGWNTTFEVQSSGIRSSEIQPNLSGNWLGIKSGFYYQF